MNLGTNSNVGHLDPGPEHCPHVPHYLFRRRGGCSSPAGALRCPKWAEGEKLDVRQVKIYILIKDPSLSFSQYRTLNLLLPFFLLGPICLRTNLQYCSLFLLSLLLLSSIFFSLSYLICVFWYFLITNFPFLRFYTSVDLAQSLLQRFQMTCLGTLKENRKGLPAAFKSVKDRAEGQGLNIWTKR
jgi:hypothetical protein